MPICKKCTNHFPNVMKIDGVFKVLNHRRFCLDCSPYKSSNTRTKYADVTTKRCPKCNDEKHVDEFYVRKNRLDPSTYCKSCSKKEGVERVRALKIKCVEYMGGKCKKCGYSKCIAALEFHHENREDKEFSISNARSYSWDRIKSELDKCTLLCCRCHREVEDELNKVL